MGGDELVHVTAAGYGETMARLDILSSLNKQLFALLAAAARQSEGGELFVLAEPGERINLRGFDITDAPGGKLLRFIDADVEGARGLADLETFLANQAVEPVAEEAEQPPEAT
jgi:hypothetical protein